MKEQAVVSFCTVWAHRNFFRDLHYLRVILDVNVRLSKRLKTPSSAIDQKWHAAPYFPGSSSSPTPGHGSAKHVFSEMIVIAVTVTDYDVFYSAPGTEQLFAEQLALFQFFCAVNFTSSATCILLRVFKSSATAQEELVRTQRRRLSLSSRRLLLCCAYSDRTHDESRAHERCMGPHGEPVRDRSNRRRTRRVSFFPVFLETVSPFWGGGREDYLSNLFGDRLSTFLATSCFNFFSRQLPVFFSGRH